MAARVLIVDDEKLIRWSLRERLAIDGCEIEEAGTVRAAEALLKRQPFDVALFDLKLPDGNGLDLLRHAARCQPETMVVIITAHSSVDNAVQAMKEGAFDYVSKPFNLDEISMTVKRAVETHGLRHVVRAGLEEKKSAFGLDALVGESEAWRRVKDIVRRVAAADSTVLLLGETGTGKDMVARAIHYESARAQQPFMNITCTAMPESLIESELFGHEDGAFTGASGRKAGFFELGHHGTIFLDEIGDMPLNLQAKLLRVLEEQAFRRIGGTADIRVDCRVIAATHRDLPQRVEEKSFREDLYYRLSTVPVRLPGLRERAGDVPLLAAHFLAVYNRQMGRDVEGFDPAASDAMQAYGWPGNVREIRNVIERAVLLAPGPRIGVEDLGLGLPGSAPRTGGGHAFPLPAEGCSLEAVQKSLLEQALERTGGNQSRAAELLGLTRDQVRYKSEKFGLPRA